MHEFKAELQKDIWKLGTYHDLGDTLPERAEYHTSSDSRSPRLVLIIVCMFEMLDNL